MRFITFRNKANRLGQAGPLFAAGMFTFGLMLMLTLSRFMNAGASEKKPRETKDLASESSVMSSAAEDSSSKQQFYELQAAEARALGVTSKSKPFRRGQQKMSFGSGGTSSLFRVGSSGGWTEAVDGSTDPSTLVADKDVVIRLLGTLDGDYIFHRTRGWMVFKGGEWVAITYNEVPRSLRSLYPYLGQSAVAAVGDSSFKRPDWMSSE